MWICRIAPCPLTGPAHDSQWNPERIAEDHGWQNAQLLADRGLAATGPRHRADTDHCCAAEGPEDRTARVQTANHWFKEPDQGSTTTVSLRPERLNVHGIVAHAAAEEMSRLSQLGAA